MKPTLSWSEYQRLELIPASVRRTPALVDRLGYVWQRLMQWSTQPQEIEVWSVCDQTGTVWWNGYDPQTGRSLRYASEHEIRTWIEQHYLN
jgi:hypothetical protein